MSIVRDPYGSLYLLQTSMVGPSTGLANCKAAIAEAQQLINSALAALVEIPLGNANRCQAPPVQIEIVDLDDQPFEILLYEPIRTGTPRTNNIRAGAEQTSVTGL